MKLESVDWVDEADNCFASTSSTQSTLSKTIQKAQ
jgi:hypothetical protein